MKVKQQQQQPQLLNSSSYYCSHQHGLRPLAPEPASPPPPPPPHEAAVAGGSSSNTRWNPTEEQIGMLEMLYSKGMRTPNSHQIESIAAELGNFGRIQPKNVFYWFQNHKARERQKLKRLSSTNATIPTAFISFHHHTSKEKPGSSEEATTSTSKKKCRSWTFDNKSLEENNSFSEHVNGVKKTLQLFPLHPEPTKMPMDN